MAPDEPPCERVNLSASQTDLDISPQAFESLVNSSLTFILPFLKQLPDSPPFRSIESNQDTQDKSSLDHEPMPSAPQALNAILSELFQDRLSTGVEYASGANLSAFPGGGLLICAAADLITSVINRYSTVWALSPGIAQIERDVIHWFIQLIGLGPSAGGILTTGSSMATFSAFLCARKKMLTQSSLSKATYYLSDLGHYACKKNAMMIGLPEKGLRIIPTNTHFKMDPQALRRQIEEDRAQGLCPTLIVANAGNTYTGNVDDLNEIANLASSTGVWLHVDAAYGGFFTLTETGKTCLKGIERADSIALDPHKTLCLPLGSGTLLVKDRQQLMSAHQCQGYRYAPTQADDAAAIDFSECSAELSRECRGLRIWLPFKMLGIDAFKRNLQDKIQLIQWAHQQILRIPNAQVISAPELTVLTFRYYQDGYDEQALNTINRGLLQTINAQNQVRLMKMTVKGQETIRICTLSFRIYRTHLETGIKLIQAAFTDTSLIKDLLET